ncbi:MAG: outer membrane lipoprotein carrier protein LolA [Planctomycetota bacterium]
MTQHLHTAILGFFGLALMGCAAAHADGPQQCQVGVDDPPFEAQAERDDVVALLGRIETAASEVQTLHAKLRYTTIQGLLGDEQVRFGQLWYAAPGVLSGDASGTQAERLAVHIQRQKLGQHVEPADQWLVFDGTFFLERNAEKRQATRREIRPPGEDAAAALPVPIRLNRAEATERFEVEQIDGPQAPAGITLGFTPRPGVETEPMQITFDAHSLLPLEVRFGEPDGDLTIFRLVEPTANPAEVDPNLFETNLPAEAGWDLQDVPFGE